MSRLKLDDAFASLLHAAFPGTSFLWNGERYDAYEAADFRGLLPILLCQAQKTASIFGEALIGDGCRIRPSANTLTEKEAVVVDEAAVTILLPFLLDAVFLARDLSPAELSDKVVNIDAIDPPVEPAFATMLAAASAEEVPETQILPE